MSYCIAAIIGFFGGVSSGLFGVGGGVIMVPAMILLLSPPIRDIKQAIGTSLVVIVPAALMGASKHFTQHNIEWRIAAAIIPTAVVGSYLGAWLTSQLSAGSLKRAFGGFIILVGLRLLLFK
jgi:uncharacterized protein